MTYRVVCHQHRDGTSCLFFEQCLLRVACILEEAVVCFGFGRALILVSRSKFTLSSVQNYKLLLKVKKEHGIAECESSFFLNFSSVGQTRKTFIH